MTGENEKDSRLASAPVGKLMLVLGLPSVCSMMLQALYNIVDSAFLSNMAAGGEEALTALGLAFPIQLLMVAVSIGTGVGTNALAARLLGQKSYEKLNKTAGNAIFLGFVITIIFILFGAFGVSWYVNSQNAAGNISSAVLSMTVDYLRICCCLAFGIIFFSIFEKLLQATGRTLYSTIAQITGAITNIILDPIMIYGLFGMPEMGVKGAAYATVIGQMVSGLMVFIFHIRLNREIDKDAKYIKPELTTIKDIYIIGFPAIISQALLTVMTYGMNIILGGLPEVGERSVTIYGLYCKVQQMIIFAAVGMRDAITPIVAFNYGMKNKKRILSGIRYGMLYTFVLMAAGTLITEIGAPFLTSLFALSGTTYGMCIDCMRIVSSVFVCAGLTIAFQGVFQAIECGIESLLISAGRQAVFILPAAAFLARFITGAENVGLIWWAFVFAEILSFLMALLMYKRAYDKKIK